ncbi:hypothetical protein [Nitrospirillum viridazoti]|uniref:hypothetical protein n=1 Tax=Nitrospirillum viridazoti TaxID=3144925 RepID=UPI0011A49660|nr:hypothetical protein [Nitrospirillum amazonense]
MIKLRICFQALLFIFLVPCAAFASSEKHLHALGIYSNIQKLAEGGDLSGFEIWYVISTDGDMVVFQSTTEMPSPPIVVPAKFDGKRLEFEIPEGEDGAGTYSGILNGKSYIGKWRYKKKGGGYGEEEFKLKKGKTYWERF